ncbi:hypothetical protein AAMO2058_000140400 [Amorphochlora amoebiformis]
MPEEIGPPRVTPAYNKQRASSAPPSANKWNPFEREDKSKIAKSVEILGEEETSEEGLGDWDPFAVMKPAAERPATPNLVPKNPADEKLNAMKLRKYEKRSTAKQAKSGFSRNTWADAFPRGRSTSTKVHPKNRKAYASQKNFYREEGGQVYLNILGLDPDADDEDLKNGGSGETPLSDLPDHSTRPRRISQLMISVELSEEDVLKGQNDGMDGALSGGGGEEVLSDMDKKSGKFNLVSKLGETRYRIFSKMADLLEEDKVLFRLKDKSGASWAGKPFSFVARRALSAPAKRRQRIGFFTLTPHPNIITPQDILSQQGARMLVFPWAKLGSIADYLRTSSRRKIKISEQKTSASPETLDIKLRLLLSRQIAEGLAHLHSHKPPLAHLGLKPNNVLIFQSPSEEYPVAKLTDYTVSGHWDATKVLSSKLPPKPPKSSSRPVTPSRVTAPAKFIFRRRCAPPPWYPMYPKEGVPRVARGGEWGGGEGEVGMDCRALGVLLVWILAKKENSSSYLTGGTNGVCKQIPDSLKEDLRANLGDDFHARCLRSALEMACTAPGARRRATAREMSSLLYDVGGKETTKGKAEKKGSSGAGRVFFYGMFAHFLLGDLQESLVALKRAAGAGHPRAQYSLACRLSAGNGVRRDSAAAVGWLRRAAVQGDADAQFNLACALIGGKGVKADAKIACKWFRKAADQGHVKAAYNLAVCYERGLGVPRMIPKALELYDLACTKGHSKAQYTLALYHDGRLGEDAIPAGGSFIKAVSLYTEAAHAGHTGAQYHLALRLFEGAKGVDPDPMTAISWLKRAAEGREGGLGAVPAAAYRLAKCYEDGDGVEKDQLRARHWYTASAEMGDVTAQVDMAKYYEETIGDSKRSRFWWKRAADQGHTEALFMMGLHYDAGQGGERDAKKAAESYIKAAGKGHIESQRRAGMCYENGLGVEKSVKKSLVWYQRAADQSDPHSQFKVAVALESGEHLPQDNKRALFLYGAAAEGGIVGACLAVARFHFVAEDEEKAREWLEKAAKQGSGEGYFGLAMIEEDKEVKSKHLEMAVETGHVGAMVVCGDMATEKGDHKGAVYWFEKAALAGSSDAHFNLGVCYENGIGVDIDEKKAMGHYLKAARMGDPDAMYNYARCLQDNGKDGTKEKDIGRQPGSAPKGDMRGAVRWYLRAAELDHIGACVNLGRCYALGHGVSKSMKPAIRWYTRAAVSGHVGAQFNVGLCYDILGNPTQAARWYARAANKGHVKAKYNLSLLYQRSVVFSVYKAVSSAHNLAESPEDAELLMFPGKENGSNKETRDLDEAARTVQAAWRRSKQRRNQD